MSRIVYLIKGEDNCMFCQFENFSDLEDMCKNYGITYLGKDSKREIWGNPETGKTYSVLAMGA